MSSITVCSYMLEYLSDPCSEEGKAFESHLADCASCKLELEQLRLGWEAIPTHIEQVKLPSDLKQQVMEAVWGKNNKSSAPDLVHKSSSRFKWLTKRYNNPKVNLVAASVLILLGASLIGNVVLIQERIEQPVTLVNSMDLPTSEIQKVMKLESLTSGTSYGIACIVGSGKDQQFVVYLFNPPETEKNEVYQVWLNKDQTYHNAGKLKVENQLGLAVLAIPMGNQAWNYDSIAITVEPDSKGLVPRGPQMFRSS
ncbi:anti-sigma factor [Paenibacillus polysaccharolyticus]|uniref:anti-sigma factor n=1 Tax=Paenibacillus polysaccharolyticus TaxID=582692 RepID=UPI0020402927|nr:anti-sigma factor [Paenibacillus polysaccharolyticus]MCM3134788.1 anti-sigma factor [Paenibacillus polysaccharolyticus]